MEIPGLFSAIKSECVSYFKDNERNILNKTLATSLKPDRSIVTEVDVGVSAIIEKQLKKLNSEVCFYSEENYGDLTFPALILDPIDGTKEFAQAIGECCVSVAYMNSERIDDPLNCAWIYNPFTGYEQSSESVGIGQTRNYFTSDYIGLVSRTEWSKGLFDNLEDCETKVVPRGSIAFKLGLLASGSAEFVITLRPKNIWDIAAGTILCDRAGIKMYHEENRVELLDITLLPKNLIWSSGTVYEKIIKRLNKLF
jgi:myo-inositol-1(or 4)-monophosphatase